MVKWSCMDAVGVRRMAGPDRARPEEGRPVSWHSKSPVIAFFSFWLLATALQVAGGCYHAEFDGYPDEPAHYITGLMVRDYLVSGELLHPMTYAENYYLHYPKVAFGHWPPGFYVVQSIWMLLFGPARASILLLMSAITAGVATVMFAVSRPWIGPWWSAGAATVFVCVPMVQANTGMVMAESLLALGGLLAASSLGRYLDTGATAQALWFGAWAAATILVKGNGWALVLLPPLALLITGRWQKVLDWRLWAGAGVAALVLPWPLAPLHMAQQGWTAQWGFDYFRTAFAGFGAILPQSLGWGLVALAVLGVAVECLAPRLAKRPAAGIPAAMLALVLAVWLFHSIVPAGVEDRKMILGLPGLLLVAAAGAARLGRWLGTKGAWAVAVAAAASFGIEAFQIPAKPVDHFAEVARTALGVWPSPADRLLVSATGLSEGAFMAEIAMHEKRPGHYVLRGTKMFADMNWSGADAKLRYTTVAEAEEQIEAWGVSGLVLETAETFADPSVALARHLTEAYVDRWTLVPLPPSCNGYVRLFRFTGERRAKPSGFEIDLRRMLGRTISSDESR